MQHISVKLNQPCEFINITPLNPLISKCEIKVCYVGDQPNRNKSIITKDVAKKMANSLPGSPIVGYYREEEKDFDEHTKKLKIVENKLILEPKTKPYGFVDLNAKCWFQKFLDDGMFEREYLMTEGYLWTGQFPECQRVIEQGNNQSMELDKNIIDAYWTKDDNGKPQFFIINEAIISKLCILGEDQEPCFEGATITKFEFSFEDSFKEEMSSMIFQLQQILEKGGLVIMDDNKELIVDEFKKEDKEKEEKKDNLEQNNKDEKEKSTEPEEKKNDAPASEEKTSEDEEDKKKKKTEYVQEEVCADCGKSISECDCSKKNYVLEDIPEYVSLKEQFEELQSNYNSLTEEKETLENTVSQLQEFKIAAERKDKEAMIEQFYMLSEEDKKDVVEHIDEYSLDDIEAKLSIICVRNKVSFNLEEEKQEETDPVSYNLNSENLVDDSVPAWVRAVRQTSKNQ